MGLLLTGCATQPGGIFNSLNLEDDSSALIGARQRAILNVPVGKGSRPGLVNPTRVVCAEPSPDVALAVAQSVGFGISILGGAQAQGAGAIDGATAEGVGQLGERTQAIQLLRDQMYRACEAYANGAITGTTYNLIMSKNNDAMITLMMAGVIGGEFGRAGLAIGGKSGAESSADVSRLLEAMAAADEADKASDKAKVEVADAEDAAEDAKMAAAENPTPENQQAAGAAEGALSDARKDLARKLDQKNAADAKAHAEITTVVGAGSIAAKPSVGVAQVLARVHDAYLREDFADEYVAACVVEMGLAGGGDIEYTRQTAKHFAQTLAFITKYFKDHEVGEIKERSDAFVDFIREFNTTNRYSLFARQCYEYLPNFIVFAHENETLIQQEKIRLDAMRATNEGDATRQEALALFEKSIATCAKVEDPATQKTCMAAAATIVERPGGTIEFGEVRTVATPVGDAPLPVAAFDAAKAERGDLDKAVAALDQATIATFKAAEVGAEASVELLKAQAAATDARVKAKARAETLKRNSDAMLVATERTRLRDRQNERPDLVLATRQAKAGSVAASIAADKLALHDKELNYETQRYRELAETIEDGVDDIKKALAQIDQFADAVTAAKKRRAAS